ncbi:orotate phosphoribosyltransferase [Gloeobacter morelensis MG652769]|uniref:Orotate phosphoribosyltransferase n=2 Tax=Gloeobacter TaxID=33071 RepID=A0ABY3PK16_9CYAN|nr:orotate phosphoribosyltransferase [Gloeobacter morelensis MG652769]
MSTAATLDALCFVICTPMPSPLDWDFARQRSELLELMRTLCYREGDFKLSSGQLSSYYIDSKKATLHPLGALLAGSLLYQRLPEGAAAIGGLTLGADPIVTAVAVVSALRHPRGGVGAFIVRKEIKKHGSQQWIEGPSLAAGTPVVIVDDVVTTGASGLQAVEKAEEAGLKVVKILALVDRHQGGGALYAGRGYPFEALFSIEEFRSR